MNENDPSHVRNGNSEYERRELPGAKATMDDTNEQVLKVRLRREMMIRHTMEAEVQRLVQRQRQLLKEIDDLRADNTVWRVHVQSMISSHSWRATAPLRGMTTIVSRGMRMCWMLARPLVAETARLLRPLLRYVLRISLVRRMSRSVLGPETRLGRRVRSFLFSPAWPQAPGIQTSSAMSADAISIAFSLRKAIALGKAYGSGES